MRLKGKRALVTAAGQGIGRACAEAFAAEGAEVFATDVKAELLSDFKGGETFVLDALDPDSIRTGVAKARPDVILNAAGFVHAGTILDATEEEWEFGFNLNVRSQFRVMKAALPGMIERGGGSIVNIGSAAGVHVAAPNRAIYGATKAAIEGLSAAVARDHITQGIRVNIICPGTVDTPSLHDRLRATGDYEQAMKDFVARQPMGRLAGPEEIARLAVYLASDESTFVTGQSHLIDGGWSL
ncbi:SDR family oxidoreductase [Pikeienuella piscinae]|uniref:SDR family oxidoreductase n=1 Tax=Pikeienuella piscinae TaxID=2748098 RepID=A0A7L5BTY2_9RHOB|nr:SDR family oxidoreductase [Pikeienuella piscinae]QIE54343.1 SDR family oxidoreductase [Pikeienuella piscinae]